MKYSIFSYIRDCIFICSLLCLIKVAYDRNYEYISAHKNSIIHELDRNFMDHIYTVQRQIHFLEENAIIAIDHTPIINDLKSRLAHLEEKYHKNSPALIALGPIGSAAIIAKEQVLHNKLLAIINNIREILYKACSLSPYEPVHNIAEGLQTNKELIKHLIDKTENN